MPQPWALATRDMIVGTVIQRTSDSFGDIVVAEHNGVRSLYFGDGELQSSILIDKPEALITDYSQAMMCALLFCDTPESILLIGLGGCSLVNFLLGAVPRCSVDVVEIREKVIDLACKFFLPAGGNERLRIVHGAGEDFIRQRDCSSYDLILVDAFDEDGPAGPLLEETFLTVCRRRLRRGGIFVINVWNRPRDNFPAFLARVTTVFGGNTLKLLLAEAYRNAIVFGFDDPAMPGNLPGYRDAAKRLQKEHRISLPMYLRLLYWQNPSQPSL